MLARPALSEYFNSGEILYRLLSIRALGLDEDLGLDGTHAAVIVVGVEGGGVEDVAAARRPGAALRDQSLGTAGDVDELESPQEAAGAAGREADVGAGIVVAGVVDVDQLRQDTSAARAIGHEHEILIATLGIGFVDQEATVGATVDNPWWIVDDAALVGGMFESTGVHDSGTACG